MQRLLDQSSRSPGPEDVLSVPVERIGGRSQMQVARMSHFLASELPQAEGACVIGNSW